jgi:hypothetical protein
MRGRSNDPQALLCCRSVTSVLNYALMLGIVTLLVAGLLTGVGDLVESQQERAIRAQLDTAGNSLAADIETASRFVDKTGGDEVRLRTELPDTVAGSHYTIEIDDAGDDRYRLLIRSSDPTVRTTVYVRSSVGVTGSVDGGQLLIEYEDGELVVTND